MNLEELIQGCKNQKPKAQADLVHQFAPGLLAVCNRYCRERSMAHDALQETFLNVFKYIHTYSHTGSFEGWLKRIAVNSSIQLLKKYKPFSFTEDHTMEQLTQAEVPDISSQLAVEDIKTLMHRLPQSLYMVFNLYVVEGFSHNEIADMLHITSSTSRSHLTKARVKMISYLNQLGPDVYETQNNNNVKLNS